MILPLIAIGIARFLPFDRDLVGVFVICCSTPVAGVVTLLAEVYGRDGSECGGPTAMTTVLSVVTIPLMFGLYRFLCP